MITKIEVLMVKYLDNKNHMKLVLGVASVSINLSKLSKNVCSGVGRGVGDKVEIILVIKLEKELN